MNRHLTYIEQQNIAELYEERYKEYGQNHKTVGWGSREDQMLRFDVLSRNLSLAGKNILDVGCGFGDFVTYLNKHLNNDFSYTGIDIAPSLVAEAKSKYSQPNIRFVCSEILNFDEGQKYDVIILSGALSYKVEDNIGYTKAVLTRLFELSNDVLSVNFLSTYVDYQAEKNFHYSPEAIFSFAKTLTPRVVLYHDYPLWEFTVQMWKI